MINLDKQQCTGCAACVDVCSYRAITLREDKNGFFYPDVDTDKCVQCGLCDRRCHILNEDKIVRNEVSKNPFAVWSKDKEIILRSASGGVFGQIATDFLKDKNSVVFGAMLTKDTQVRHVAITEKEDVALLQGSKYQQCDATGAYELAKDYLKKGWRVLYSGTPCMIAALKVYLSNNQELLQNLYTAELLCHGVPSNELYRMGLRIENAKRIVKYRTKSQGWLKGNRVVYEAQDGDIYEKQNRRSDFVFRTYLTFSLTRPNCFRCRYARMDRVADLTMGDFWGLDRKKHLNHEGVSLLLVNSEKGKRLIDGSSCLSVKIIGWRDCMPYNQNLFMATNKRVYNLSEKIADLRRLPFGLRRVIYQNGFSNKYLDLLYQIVYNILTIVKRSRIKNQIKDEESRNYNNIFRD
jgi:coenzyme F420-reducing hydrogenase beta subunit